MQKFQERLDHALHNEKVCEHLTLKPEFTDWIITTAFYSSLHFVSYLVFPYKYKGPKEVKSFDTVDDYVNYRKETLGDRTTKKHSLLVDIAEEICPEISDRYSRLLGLSHNARYLNYQHPPQAANLARTILHEIKKHCTRPPQQAAQSKKKKTP